MADAADEGGPFYRYRGLCCDDLARVADADTDARSENNAGVDDRAVDGRTGNRDGGLGGDRAGVGNIAGRECVNAAKRNADAARRRYQPGVADTAREGRAGDGNAG